MARGKRTAAAGGLTNGPWALPDGWSWEHLGDCVDVNPRTELPDTGSVSFVPMAAVGAENFTIDVSQRRPVKEAARNYTRFQSGDVLFAKITPCMENGKIAIVPKTDEGVLAGSTEFHVLRSSKLDARLLAYWLVRRTFRETARRNMTGTAGQMRVPADYLRDTVVPVPPADLQMDMLTRIDELFTEIADGEVALAQARADLEVYRRSLLKAAVTGELTADWRAANPPKETGADLLGRILAERRARWQAGPRNGCKRRATQARAIVTDLPQLPAGWTWARLPQLGDFGRGKSRHRPRDDARLYGGAYPFVQTGIVSNSDGKIRRFDQTYSDFGLLQSKLWPAGTVCITIAANIAKSGVLGFDACFPDSVVGLACTEGVSPEYVHLVVANLQTELERSAPATAQKNINLDVLEQVAVPLPPSNEQWKIVEQFHLCLDAADVVSRDELDREIATLRQSILAAAFRGELAA